MALSTTVASAVSLRGESLWGKAMDSIRDEDLKSRLKSSVKTHRRDVLVASALPFRRRS